MGSVTFYEGIGYTGKRRTIKIGNTSAYQILLYENSKRLFSFIINISSGLSNINNVINTQHFFLYSEVDPSFNGIILKQTMFVSKETVFNYVLPKLQLELEHTIQQK